MENPPDFDKEAVELMVAAAVEQYKLPREVVTPIVELYLADPDAFAEQVKDMPAYKHGVVKPSEELVTARVLKADSEECKAILERLQAAENSSGEKAEAAEIGHAECQPTPAPVPE